MGCGGGCGGPKAKSKVRVTSNYVPANKVNHTEMLLSLKVEREKNVRPKGNTGGS